MHAIMYKQCCKYNIRPKSLVQSCILWCTDTWYTGHMIHNTLLHDYRYIVFTCTSMSTLNCSAASQTSYTRTCWPIPTASICPLGLHDTLATSEYGSTGCKRLPKIPRERWPFADTTTQLRLSIGDQTHCTDSKVGCWRRQTRRSVRQLGAV